MDTVLDSSHIGNRLAGPEARILAPDEVTKLLNLTRKLQGIVLFILLPAILTGWVVASNLLDLDVTLTARAASLTFVPLITLAIFFPLGQRYPQTARWRVYVVQWFLIALFFNVAWQVPQVLFKSWFAAAEHNHANLPMFIAWWGYATCDLDYGRLTPYFVVAEITFWITHVFSIAGLIQLRRNADGPAFLLFALCGAVQCYNVIYFFIYAGIVEGFTNIASDSLLSPLIYWVFNGLWLVGSGLACALASKYLLQLGKFTASR